MPRPYVTRNAVLSPLRILLPLFPMASALFFLLLSIPSFTIAENQSTSFLRRRGGNIPSTGYFNVTQGGGSMLTVSPSIPNTTTSVLTAPSPWPGHFLLVSANQSMSFCQPTRIPQCWLIKPLTAVCATILRQCVIISRTVRILSFI